MMKKWNVKHTRDGVNFDEKTVEGRSYTEAYVKFEVAYPDEFIDEITEIKE